MYYIVRTVSVTTSFERRPFGPQSRMAVVVWHPRNPSQKKARSKNKCVCLFPPLIRWRHSYAGTILPSLVQHSERNNTSEHLSGTRVFGTESRPPQTEMPSSNVCFRCSKQTTLSTSRAVCSSMLCEDERRLKYRTWRQNFYVRSCKCRG